MREEIIDKLKLEFEIFEFPDEYIENLVDKIINKGAKNARYENAQKRIMTKIKYDWNNLNIDWFIKYLESSIFISDSIEEKLETIGKVIDFLTNYGLILDKNTLFFVIQESDAFDELISSCFEGEYTLNKINDIASDKVIFQLFYNYAVIYGYIEELKNDEISKEKMPTYYLEYLSSIEIPNREEVAEWFKSLEIARRENDLKKVQFYRDKIIIGHIRYVMFKIYSYLPYTDFSLDDLVQLASLALLNTVDYFDYRKGIFTVYLNKIIKQIIFDNFNYNRTIKISRNNKKILIDISKLKFDADKNGKELKLDEIAEILNIDINKLKELLLLSEDAISLDEIDDVDNIVEPFNDTKFWNDDLSEKITSWLNKLDHVSSGTLRMRYGIQDYSNPNYMYESAHSLSEIASYEGITKNAVHLREKSAFSRLRRLPEVRAEFSKKCWMFKDFFLDGQLILLDSLIEKYLDFQEKEAIYTLGKNFEVPIYDYSENKDIIFKAIAKLKTLLNSLEEFTFEGYSNKDLRALFNCDDDEFYALLEVLEKNPIYKKVTEPMNNVISRSDLQMWCMLVENRKIDIVNLQNIKNKTLNEVLGCTYEELTLIKYRIIYRESWLNLCRLCGDELEDKINYNKLLIIGIESFYEIFGSLRTILAEIRLEKKSLARERKRNN